MNDDEIREAQAMLDAELENWLYRYGEILWARLQASLDATKPPTEPPAAFTRFTLATEDAQLFAAEPINEPGLTWTLGPETLNQLREAIESGHLISQARRHGWTSRLGKEVTA